MLLNTSLKTLQLNTSTLNRLITSTNALPVPASVSLLPEGASPYRAPPPLLCSDQASSPSSAPSSPCSPQWTGVQPGPDFLQQGLHHHSFAQKRAEVAPTQGKARQRSQVGLTTPGLPIRASLEPEPRAPRLSLHLECPPCVTTGPASASKFLVTAELSGAT